MFLRLMLYFVTFFSTPYFLVVLYSLALSKQKSPEHTNMCRKCMVVSSFLARVDKLNRYDKYGRGQTKRVNDGRKRRNEKEKEGFEVHAVYHHP